MTARVEIEKRLRVKFIYFLDDLDDEQVVALEENWSNIMEDAALDRIDSWIFAGVAIAELRKADDEKRAGKDAPS